MTAKVLQTRRNSATSRKLSLKRAKIMWVISIGRRSIAAVVGCTLTITNSPHLGVWGKKECECERGVLAVYKSLG